MSTMELDDEAERLARRRERRRRARQLRRARKRAANMWQGRQFVEDHPGHPLGAGMPMGKPLRMDFLKPETGTWRGESHHEAWQRIMRWDPCSYCGAVWAGTVDHIAPKSKAVTGLGGAHSWLNVAGSCAACNERKSDQSLLMFLAKRRGIRQR